MRVKIIAIIKAAWVAASKTTQMLREEERVKKPYYDWVKKYNKKNKKKGVNNGYSNNKFREI